MVAKSVISGKYEKTKRVCWGGLYSSLRMCFGSLLKVKWPRFYDTFSFEPLQLSQFCPRKELREEEKVKKIHVRTKSHSGADCAFRDLRGGQCHNCWDEP